MVGRRLLGPAKHPRPYGGRRPRPGRRPVFRRDSAPGCLGLVLFLAGLPRASHGALDEGVLRVLGEEQHDFATRALSGIAVLQPSRAIAKHRLAARALDLDEAHTPTTMMIGNRRPR